MARIPISFYLNILAGILVLFNHFATSETGDVAFNKVTGAAGRFYTLFQDTALAFHHSCTSHLEAALCGPALDSVFSYDAAEYLRVRYCRAPSQDSESTGGMSNEWQRHEGYGGSDFVAMYYRPRVWPLPPLSAQGLLRQSSQSHLSQAVWDQSSKAMMTIGVLLLRTCGSWWWFRSPFRVTGVLLATYSVLSAFGYLFGASVVLRAVSQMYVVTVADFLQCIEWEAQRQVLDVGVVMIARAYDALSVNA